MIEFAATMDEVGLSTGDRHQFEVYIVIIKGTKIGFFEYHNDQDELDDNNIPHLRGCTSLTQDYEIRGRMATVLENKPDGMEPLYHNTRLFLGDLKNGKNKIYAMRLHNTSLSVY